MSSKAQKTAIKDLICYIIMFVIMFGIGNLTPAEPLTVKGMQLLGLSPAVSGAGRSSV